MDGLKTIDFISLSQFELSYSSCTSSQVFHCLLILLYMAILLHVCDDYRSLITHYRTTLEVRRAGQDLFKGVKGQGQVLFGGLDGL